jgi:hypothetical protein
MPPVWPSPRVIGLGGSACSGAVPGVSALNYIGSSSKLRRFCACMSWRSAAERGRYFAARAKVILACFEALEDLELKYTMPSLASEPSYARDPRSVCLSVRPSLQVYTDATASPMYGSTWVRASVCPSIRHTHPLPGTQARSARHACLWMKAHIEMCLCLWPMWKCWTVASGFDIHWDVHTAHTIP